MKRYLGPIYHSIALVHHLYAMKETAELDFSKSDDLRVTEMKEFAHRYFTTWNLILQTMYLVVAVSADTLHFLPKNFRNFENQLLMLRGYLFTTFIFPCTLFVFSMFWGLYSIDREWVLPAVVDSVIPKWLNHSVHTVILIPIIMEILITNQLLPTFKKALIGLSIFIVIYDILFFFTYYEHGRWLYGLFYVLTWEERIGFMVLNYLAVVIIMKMGIVLQYLRKRYINELYDEESKILKEA